MNLRDAGRMQVALRYYITSHSSRNARHSRFSIPVGCPARHRWQLARRLQFILRASQFGKSISCINLKVASRVPLVTSLVVAGARVNLATGLGARLRELGAVPDRDSLSEGPLSPAEYANCQLPSPAPSTTLVIDALTLHGARARRL